MLRALCHHLVRRISVQQTRRPPSQYMSNMAEQSRPPPQFYRRTLPATCTSFSSEKGKQIFAESLAAGHLEGYFSLAAQFRTQDEPAFCGLSTLVMTLNSLEVDPQKVWKGPWRWYHESMLDCCVPLEVAEKTGINLDQFACLAACNTLKVVLTRVEPSSSVDTFREAVKTATRCEDQVIIVSYSRRVLEQTGDGHFSPIGGFHPESDMVLIMDTARFKYPPHWVSLSLLFDAMKAIDKDTGLPRGYMLLSKGCNTPLLMFRVSSALSIPLPQSSETLATGVQGFLTEWERWLTANNSVVGEELLEQAVVSLVQAAGHLGDSQSLLTTQVDVSCKEMLSKQHQCIVDELNSAINKLPMKLDIQKILSSEKVPPNFHKLGEPAVIKACQFVANDDLENIGEPQPKRHCTLGMLETSHFVTVLLLAWPYHKCDQSNGLFLQRLAVSQLSKTSALLQSEIAQLKHQLSSVLGLMEKCATCNKCTKL